MIEPPRTDAPPFTLRGRLRCRATGASRATRLQLTAPAACRVGRMASLVRNQSGLGHIRPDMTPNIMSQVYDTCSYTAGYGAKLLVFIEATAAISAWREPQSLREFTLYGHKLNLCSHGIPSWASC